MKLNQSKPIHRTGLVKPDTDSSLVMTRTDGHDWLHTNIRLKPFSQKVVVYGFVTDNSEYDFLINILILGKVCIHKYK